MSNYGSESSFAKSTGETGVIRQNPENNHRMINREGKLLGYPSRGCSTPKLNLTVAEYRQDPEHECALSC
ncbi:Mg(2+) chelatase family protein/ComM-related protein [Lasiodiplodia theobromae]|uniref:Mg(2+) chelatase family protein/ComM-related protein n=1 Tax=Lasiodiplodia theobromae TaxID=45133 RepID=UPI0015C34908|nr:Mg(2+) chelatase family protein/ComM-related protein [Lasiodiplodia theobromae]KAF4537828.1 Mg(2+) chelatase family protein/ComM-related protein [Lasiodiplodia theobromae]